MNSFNHLFWGAYMGHKSLQILIWSYKYFCQVSVKEAKNTVDLWYNDRKEVLRWQQKRKKEAFEFGCVYTLLGRARQFPEINQGQNYYKGHIERAAINTPVQVLNSFIYINAIVCNQHSLMSITLLSTMVTYFSFKI